MWVEWVVWAALGCGTKPPAAAVDPSGCRVVAGAGFAGCAGQEVGFTGTLAQLPAQHPMLGPPGGPVAYVDVDGAGQVVVEGEVPTGCAGPVDVVGTLFRVELGGAEGTPESYRGWRVAGATVTCR